MSLPTAELDAKVADLAGGVPIALLPVRLETRFVGDELRVRIFPDQIHLDSHEPELTAAERAAGTAYWQARFAEPDPDNRSTSPWRDLCAVVGPARAAWLVAALTPVNLDQIGPAETPRFPATDERPDTWSAAARATALPERWLVVGLRAGVEVCRVWTVQPVAERLEVSPAPELDGDPPPAAAGDGPSLQDPARWLVDFDAAEQAGMAVRIPDAQVSGGVAAGFDRLVVLGFAWSLDPEQAAAALERLLAAHAYDDGLSMITPGTPTNETANTRPGAAPATERLIAALDPEQRPAAASVAGSGAERLWRGLGLDAAPGELLTAVPGATERSQEIASRLADALWESTLGAFLTDVLTPVFPDTRTALLRDHVRQHLYPGGPFPALRVARQPYGVLPVLAGGFAPDPADALEAGLTAVLAKLRIFWQRAVPAVPRLGRTADLDADLTELLQTTPLTAALRYRTVLGPLTVSATVGLDRHAVAQQYITSMLGVHLGVPPPTVWNEFALHPGHEHLDVPLADAESNAGLAELVALARTSGRYDPLKAREEDSRSLLDALAVHAVARELHRADLRVVDDFRVASGQLAARPPVGVLPLAEYVAIEATDPPPAGSVLLRTPSEVSRVVIPGVTGSQTVREFVTAALGGAAGPVELTALDRVLRALDSLSTRSPAELDHGLRGLLDAYGYRLDAWYTSLATRRLARMRAERPTGVHLGAYGWVEDLRPAAGGPRSHGFIHAPSLSQAATAAVLRSGHLAHRDPEHAALEVDLTAERVRVALDLLDGVAQGQPLAALLGYRFERAVRARGLGLAQYLLPFRRLVPLRPDGSTPAAPAVSDHLAARDVVDGVGLLERWRTDGPALFDALQQYVAFPPPPAEVFVMPPESQRQILAEELDRLADCYDAVADVLVAESVHQNVLGNRDRAGAALTALDRQGRPPRLEFVRTPRTGKSYTQRLLVLIGDDSFPPSWPTPIRDVRSAAEPRLNAWLARMIGTPRRVRFAARLGDQPLANTVTLEQLGLSPLAAVMASHRPSDETSSELEERLRHAFVAELPSAARDRTLTLLDDPPSDGNANLVGLGAFRALTRWAYTVITTHRPATAADLALPQDQVAEAPDDVELAGRADALALAYAAVRQQVDAARAAPAPTDQELLDALWAAAAFGMDGAVPPPPVAGDQPWSAADLRARLDTVAGAMAGAAAALAALDQAGAGATPPARVEHQVACIRALLGAGFPVLPLFRVADPDPLTASQADRRFLIAGDQLAAGDWLSRVALVRAGVERLARVRSAAELTRADAVPRDLVVLQLPHTPRQRWLALPYARDAQGAEIVPPAQLAIVAHCPGPVDFGAPLAGLFADAWAETIPAREETTGLAFHHDAPGARAPQTVLLAVPPAAVDPAWSVSTVLDTVAEARALARIRGVGPDRLEWLGTLLPAILLPDSASPDLLTASLRKLAARTATPEEP
jgi:hypothetical protein